MLNSLELEEFEIIHYGYTDYERTYEVKAKAEPFFCTNCAYCDDDAFAKEGKFKYYDTRKRTVRDVDAIDGKKVKIIIHQRRYTCPFCNTTFSEFFDSICRRDKVTVRLWERMGQEVLLEHNTFASVARRYGVSATTVARAFKEHVENLDKERTLKAPKYLGIDEVYIKVEKDNRKQALAVFTDLDENKILEIIDCNDKNSVVEVIKSLEGYENIKGVAMDMNSTYRNAVNDCIPNAYCVVDHYHIVQKVEMALDTVRTEIQSKLPDGEKDTLFKLKDAIRKNRDKLTDEQIFKVDTVLEKYPKLKASYWIKEGLRDVYNQTNKYDAFQMYYKWECSIKEAKKEADKIMNEEDKYDLKEMIGIQKMINRLKKEVFAYFDDGKTNAFTERFNRDIKDKVRIGNGYRFETLRAKVLYGTKATKPAEWKNMNFTKMFNMLTIDENVHKYEEPNELIKGWGVDLATICDILEKGEIGV
jgi:transposase